MNQFITEENRKEYFAFLDNLRDSGAINMYGAAPYLIDAFPILGFDEPLARQVLREWQTSNNKE